MMKRMACCKNHFLQTRSRLASLRPTVASVATSACLALFVIVSAAALWAAEDATVVEARMAKAVKYLASAKLEGRGPGTRGLDLAADYIADQFAQLDVKTDLYDGTPFQKFELGMDVRLGPAPKNRLSLVGPPEEEGGPPQRIELKLGEDFMPMGMGGSRKFDLPLVFAGYGITAEEAAYDDYRDLDVTGRAVVILRKEPQQDDAKSKFNGKRPSKHATFESKVANALSHGAAAVIVVNDRFDMLRRREGERRSWQSTIDKLAEANAKFKEIADPTPEQFAAHLAEVNSLADRIKVRGEVLSGPLDKLVGVSSSKGNGDGKLPVLFAARAALDPVVKAALGTDLAALEAEIDEGPAPRSGELASWRIAGETRIVRKMIELRNVVAVLEGEGPLADETVVVGAHYDHLGYRASLTGSFGPEDIFNGADDNASGTAALIEVARCLSQREKKLPRRVVFIAFSGEERGLLGSRHYMTQPLFPLEKTVAMVNLDMVGRLRDEKLYAMGAGTADEFGVWIDEINKNYGFVIDDKPTRYGTSDHAPFRSAKIPVLHFITGGHADLHRTTDDFEKINVSGMRRVTEMITDFVARVAQAEKRPEFKTP